jgi:PAT family beta-lactamase induction signal transducer AmpG
VTENQAETDSASAPPKPPVRPKRSAKEVIAALSQPKVAVMAALGFGSGLPFMLVGNTLNYWLADAKVDLAAIGFASWIGLTYIFKFLWGAVVDNVRLPGLGALGRRRSWLILTQVGVAAGLAGMAAIDPKAHLGQLVAVAVGAAFASAMQDTVVDAWRIEAAETGEELDLLTSAYSLGYRIALILTASVVLFIAQRISWPGAYLAFAAAMILPIVGWAFAEEPKARGLAPAVPGVERSRFNLMRVVDAVVGPFLAFFVRHGPAALLILLMVTCYHLCDYLRGPVINPFYVELHLSKDLVGTVRLTVGIASAMIGIAAGGLFAARFGHMVALISGAMLQPLAVAAFAILAVTGPDPRVFAAVMAFDDFCMSFAGLALVAYISTLTIGAYTATQYALLTSALNWTGKILKGFSGSWVKGIAKAHGGDLVHAYATYFIYAALSAGIPAFLLVLALTWVNRRKTQPADASASVRTS